MPHRYLKDLTVVFLAEYRWRGAGFKDVLSPSFDYWDGYSVLLPKGPIEWSEYGGEPPKAGHELIRVMGHEDILPCPFCGKVPKWRFHGRFIGASPNDSEYFYLECCNWFNGFKLRGEDPLKIVKERNNALTFHHYIGVGPGAPHPSQPMC